MNKKSKILNLFGVIGLFFCLIASVYAASTYDTITSWHAFPGSAKSPAQAKLLVERRIPKTITPDQEYSFYLKVTNQSMYKIDHVVVVEDLPDNFTYISAQPSPSVKGNSLVWKIGMMAPRQKETIIIKGKAIKAGNINHSGKAIVAYDLGSMTTVMDVVEAKLNMELDYPRNAVVSENIPVKITLANLGTADVKNAKLVHKLTEGLKTISGSQSINMPVGTIIPNDSKVLNLNLKAQKGGKYSENFVIKGDDGVQADATMNLTVGKPVLYVASKAPSKRFVGNNIYLTLDVKNNGDGVAKNTKTVLSVPYNTKFKSATEGGTLETNKVVWNIGTLAPGDAKKLTAVLVGKKISNLSTTATTTADAAKTITSIFKTEIAGIPALLINLSDVNDPVPVGGYEIYNVSVSNQGSLAASDVVVKCKMEPSMEFVSVKGPTGKQSTENNILTLKPLASLAPGNSVSWKVTVKALKAGDVRFEVYTESKQLTRPVFENESTHFYND